MDSVAGQQASKVTRFFPAKIQVTVTQFFVRCQESSWQLKTRKKPEKRIEY
jgi:hypothetical protein